MDDAVAVRGGGRVAQFADTDVGKRSAATQILDQVLLMNGSRQAPFWEHVHVRAVYMYSQE